MDTADSGETADSGDSGETADSGDSGETGDSGESGETAADTATGLTERPANPTCLAPARPASTAAISSDRVYPRVTFSHPTDLQQRPGDDTRLYVVQQGGEIAWVDNVADPAASTTALDLSSLVSAELSNEDGLLGLAFHPDFGATGDIYVNYTAGSLREGTLRSVVARYHSDDGGDSFDPDSATILLEIAQPFDNHNGGHLRFGPDGYLYLGFGDGGDAGDPYGNAQDPDSLLGKMLRIDVDAPSGDREYGIPADNPFASGGGAPEIYAMGLRNPWSFSFDRATGDLWVGDVGQETYDEIDVVELGGNYGWNEVEGIACYTSGCSVEAFAAPVVALPHADVQSVLGGHVYRGAAIPALSGAYFFGDSFGGELWMLGEDASTGLPVATPLLPGEGRFYSATAEDQAGEVFLADYGGGGIYRVNAAGKPEPDTFPATLSATGCVDAADPTVPASGLIPYEVRMPLWSDGAEKSRWIALPDGATIHVQADGTFDLPVGSVLMKEFRLDGRRVETRLLVRHDDGEWAGYSYAWREDGSDADLLAGSATVAVGDTTWRHPTRGECLICHSAAAGRVLGPRLLQLNGDVDYGGGPVSQLDTWSTIGMFDAPLADASTLPAYPTLGAGDVADESRAYLAVNCATCHVPGGSGLGSLDLGYEIPLAATGACDVAPVNGDLGVEDARLVAPGDPSRSVLSLRMHATGIDRMPAIGSAVVDDAALAVIDAWIAGLTGCE